MMEKSAPSQETRSIEIFIKPEQRRSYFNLPFTMPENVDSFTLAYHYDRSSTSDSEGGFTDSRRVNTIDLGLIAPDGSQAGASGSDKSEISIGPTSATPGYNAVPLEAGEWQIMVGAYKIASEGVRVTYDLTFTFKQPRWLRGDFHTHTIASDGVLTAGELGIHALRHGLDFLAITDHNQFVSAAQLPQIPGLTLIQGVEWTHYEGHANFLGVDRPYNEPFPTSTPAETLSRFTSARQRGALIVINHPFDEGSGFNFDFHTLPFDCLEIWNGPMRESNLQAVGMWRSLLAAGQKIPIVGGSDYHRDNLFQILGVPPPVCTAHPPAQPTSSQPSGKGMPTWFTPLPVPALNSSRRCDDGRFCGVVAWGGDADRIGRIAARRPGEPGDRQRQSKLIGCPLGRELSNHGVYDYPGICVYRSAAGLPAGYSTPDCADFEPDLF